MSVLNASEIVPILSGGGTRLSCHIGILQALNELNLSYRHLVGVSGGSIVAAFYAAGWPLKRIEQLALDTDFRYFKGISLTTLLRTGGLCNGNRFEQWLDALLEQRTFADLELDLHVLATDISGGGPVIFNRQLTPEVRVSAAIRYSMSIPLFFSFKSYRDKVLTDGVILSEDALHRDWSGQGLPLVCFRLKSESETRPIRTSRYLPVVSYMQMLIQTFMNAVSREYVHAEYWHNTVVVNTGEVSAVNFELTVAQKQLLYLQGYKTALDIVPRKLPQLFLPVAPVGLSPKLA
ncbi:MULTISPECIES: patatin-like phospholipase family protein [Alishewanella]|uniref:Patatin n=1 Tax=Alishewanella jeotgali KCTC 22429 TaxID=1129374 RepID=H3ZG00_9ALTE|nr:MULTISPECIES: patatin-like phospholipase family protein [Alishewanella]EHR40508.1 patatin [Alishewanella jeotgali KCTC 22429]MCT8124893.1 patatin-like phospholipase family protein [Alishewanella sp. BS5-314]